MTKYLQDLLEDYQDMGFNELQDIAEAEYGLSKQDTKSMTPRQLAQKLVALESENEVK